MNTLPRRQKKRETRPFAARISPFQPHLLRCGSEIQATNFLCFPYLLPPFEPRSDPCLHDQPELTAGRGSPVSCELLCTHAHPNPAGTSRQHASWRLEGISLVYHFPSLNQRLACRLVGAPSTRQPSSPPSSDLSLVSLNSIRPRTQGVGISRAYLQGVIWPPLAAWVVNLPVCILAFPYLTDGEPVKNLYPTLGKQFPPLAMI
ncbi:hypothetical protein V2G26_000532 [Clonostachys chloroleuca]